MAMNEYTIFLLYLLAILGFVAVIPFPTSLIGEYGDLPLAVIVYASTLGVAGLVGTACWLYAAYAGLLHPDVTPVEVRVGALRGIAVPIIMFGSLALLPLLGAELVEDLWLLLFPFQFLIVRLVRRIAGG